MIATVEKANQIIRKKKRNIARKKRMIGLPLLTLVRFALRGAFLRVGFGVTDFLIFGFALGLGSEKLRFGATSGARFLGESAMYLSDLCGSLWIR